jgi:putative endonuclease
MAGHFIGVECPELVEGLFESGHRYSMPDLFATIPCPTPVPGLFWIYVLQSADGSLYIGQTNHLPERLRKHRLGLGSKHTHDHGQPRLVHCEGPVPPAEAVQRERQLKRWSRAKKEALLRGDLRKLQILARSRDERG